MFQNIERHEMELVQTHPNGAVEWHCPICNRRFIMQLPPNYKRVILEAGDEEAIHCGGKGGAFMHPPEAPASRRQLDSEALRDGTRAPHESVNHERGYCNGESGLSPLFLAAIDELDFSPLLGNLEDEDGESREA